MGLGPRDGVSLGGVLDQGVAAMLRAPHVLVVGAVAVVRDERGDARWRARAARWRRGAARLSAAVLVQRCAMFSPSPLPRNLEASFRDLASEKPATRASAIRDVVRHALRSDAHARARHRRCSSAR